MREAMRFVRWADGETIKQLDVRCVRWLTALLG
jgi:hypothetical protein